MRVHRYLDQSLAVFHGPRRLANYKANGKLTPEGRRPLRNFKAASGLGIPQNQGVSRNRKSGQSICYKTGQFYLLLTRFARSFSETAFANRPAEAAAFRLPADSILETRALPTITPSANAPTWAA